MQNSNYGESVKFYEKINQLHGQLKNYEEEQFTLEAEFDRLCVMETRPANVDTVAVSESKNNAAQQNNSNNNNPSNSFLSGEQGKFEDSGMEDRRRRRNDEILRKIKELEANASLFAARSEKLRILRSQYETLVRKYMASRSNNKSLLIASKPTPSLTSAYSFLNNNNINAHVSIGVNTNISIEPEPSTDKIPKTMDYNLNPSINNHVDIDGDVSTTPYENQKTPFQIQQQQIPSTHFSAIPNAIKPNQTTFTNGHLFNNNNNGLENDDIFKTSEKPNKTDFTIKPSLLSSKYSLRQNTMMDYSDRENEGRLRHNHFFDLSTTSESDLTSLGIRPTNNNNNTNKNKPKMILPLNFNFDDTTQSDNTASITMPSKLLPNTQNTPNNNLLNYKKIKVPQLPISLTTTTTTSDISTVHTTQSHQHNNKQGQMAHPPEKTGILDGKRIPVTYYLDEAEVGRGIIMDNDHRVDDTQGDIDNDELDISEGLTTSPGDSVMDSVQNRTLNESLPREIVLETTATTATKMMMVMKEESATAAAINITTTDNKVIEENASKGKEEKTMDRFLVTSIENTTDKDDGTEKDSKLVYYGMKMSSSTPEKNSTTIAMTSKTDERTTTTKTNNFERNVTGAETSVVKESSQKAEQEKVEDPWENNTFSIGNKTKPTNRPEVEKEMTKSSVELPVLTESSKDNKKLPSTQPTATSSTTTSGAVVVGSGSRRVRLKFDDYDSDSDSVQHAVINPRKKIDGDPSGTKPELSLVGGTGKKQVDVTDDDEDSFFD